MRPAAVDRWFEVGLGELTGRPDGPPLAPPAGVIERIAALGDPIGADALALATERAPLLGLRRGGAVSCGGATWLLPAADGWVALSLARETDVELLPAFLGIDDPSEVPAVVAAIAAADLRAAAVLLGLPFAVLGETAVAPSRRPLATGAGRPPRVAPSRPSEATAARSGAGVPTAFGASPVTATRLGDAERLDRPPLVVDLSSLWAGPLCSRLLLERGATVVKVESASRPDGSRQTPAFFARLNDGKEQRSVDPSEFAAIIASADVVVEGSRPRAFEQLGIVAAELAGPRVWVSITGHGRDRANRERVAFGDDAAVAGGLVVHDDAGPCFAGDAIADPLTGVAAAAAATAALEAGGRWLLDAALARTAAWCAAGSGT